MKYSKTDLAYTAGIVDGEGCIQITVDKHRHTNINARPNHGLRVVIEMCDKQLIHWLHRSYGGSMCKTIRKNNPRPSYSWKLCSIQAKEFLILIFPYLRLKHKQARLGKEFQNRMYRRGRIHIDDKEFAVRERYKARISNWNY